jgi:hypothetical protein
MIRRFSRRWPAFERLLSGNAPQFSFPRTGSTPMFDAEVSTLKIQR